MAVLPCYIFRTSAFAKSLAVILMNAEIQRIVDDMFDTMYARRRHWSGRDRSVDIHQRIIVIDVSRNREEQSGIN